MKEVIRLLDSLNSSKSPSYLPKDVAKHFFIPSIGQFFEVVYGLEDITIFRERVADKVLGVFHPEGFWDVRRGPSLESQ